jgi:hypothetical protein
MTATDLHEMLLDSSRPTQGRTAMLTATLRAEEAVDGSRPLDNFAMLAHDDRDAPEDRALFDHFLAARRRARGPVVCVNGRTVLMNAAADGVLQQEDVDELWKWACQALAENDGSVHALRLRDMQLSARCEAISDGSEVIGALIRVGTSATAGSSVQRRPDPKRPRASLG